MRNRVLRGELRRSEWQGKLRAGRPGYRCEPTGMGWLVADVVTQALEVRNAGANRPGRAGNQAEIATGEVGSVVWGAGFILMMVARMRRGHHATARLGPPHGRGPGEERKAQHEGKETVNHRAEAPIHAAMNTCEWETSQACTDAAYLPVPGRWAGREFTPPSFSRASS